MATFFLYCDLVASASAIVLAWRLREALRRERAADKVGELLCAELAELKEFAASQAALLCHLHRTNYELACQVHGKEVVDHAIEQSHKGGRN